MSDNLPAWAIEKEKEIFSQMLSSNPKHQFAIARALVAERERAAKYHDGQIADLKTQIAANDEYKLRSGHQSNAANDYCRSLIYAHEVAAAAIRKGEL